tara:strand:- start:525 stop:1094 length:570 start_codon:yes stop_codon:yes gene_type:complete
VTNQSLEFLEIYTPDGLKTGKKATKSHIHKKGLFHSTVHVWIFSDKGNVLIQKRSKKKKLNPGVWDVSVAGHIKYKEDIEVAAIRETFEETGICIKEKDLFKLGIYKSVSNHIKIIDKEFHHTYILKIDEDKINQNYKNDEVDDLKLISLEEMDLLLNQNNRDIFIGKNKNYYKDVFEAILKITKENCQ